MVEPFSVSIVIWLTSVNIQMAAWLSGEHRCAKIIDYLLHISGGSIDVSDLQYWIWIGFADFHGWKLSWSETGRMTSGSNDIRSIRNDIRFIH